MHSSWIKIGSRAAVLIVMYLLLSVPNTKYQYFNEEVPGAIPFSTASDKLITDHISIVRSYSDEEKSSLYNSLIAQLSYKLNSLKSKTLDSNNLIIDAISRDFGRAAAIVSLSSYDSQSLLDNLWLWRSYLKEQSIFWDISNEDQKKRLASSISFIGQCEDFIAINKDLHYTKLTQTTASFDTSSTLENIVSGDLLLTSYDISYSYLEQAKSIPELSTSIGLIVINGDSSFYTSATPTDGLHITATENFINKPFAKRILLRLRDDIPEITANPAIPHFAANFAYELAVENDIDYDFTFNQLKQTSLCEVGLLQYAYEGQNIDFTTSFSPTNDTFVYSLNRLGIRNNLGATSSEILFHPSIEVVGLQLSGENIKRRNLKMASTIVNLTTIDTKLMKSLRWKLPYYRLLKGYSHIVDLMGNTPPIPKGMAPETVLIHNYINDKNEELLPILIDMALHFELKNNYFPTYNMLCEMGLSKLEAREYK
jgi:hypothetical protein